MAQMELYVVIYGQNDKCACVTCSNVGAATFLRLSRTTLKAFCKLCSMSDPIILFLCLKNGWIPILGRRLKL